MAYCVKKEYICRLTKALFDSLSSKLDKAFQVLKGHGKITEINVAETLKELNRAADVDVNFKIAKISPIRSKKKPWGRMC